MVHSFDMPSETIESNGIKQSPSKNFSKSFTAAFGAALKKRRSIDASTTSSDPPTSAAADAPPESWSQMHKQSTECENVKDGLVLHVPNGMAMDGRVEQAASLRSRRSSALEEGKRSGETMKEATTRPGAAEEGFINSRISNGNPTAPAKPSLGRIASPNPSGEAGLTTASRSSLGSSPLNAATVLSPVEEFSPAQPAGNLSADGMFKPSGTVPHHHRASSPPAFSPTTSPSLSAKSPALPPHTRPDRLTHRHTLEVPKIRTAAPRDSTEQSRSSDAPVSVSGKFSPNTPTKRRGSLHLSRRPTRSIHSDMHLDVVPQDDDAARWTEHIKSRRASKRTRADTDDDRVVVGTKVDENHVNWVTAYNMLTGIRFCVSRVNAKLDRELTDADFVAKHKFSFDITGTELTPSAMYDFKFKDYAPWVFRHLRAKFRIDPADYLVSLTAKYILSELGSPGKSGSFFYFSRDYKYIIKTIHRGEHKFLRKILKEYYNHVTENPNTLLSQFYGLHRVKIPYGRKIHFVVMNNLFPPHRDIHRTFDLKGSTIGRDFREEELERNPRATLKDLNWLRRNLHLEFGPVKKEAFVTQMQKDVVLLQKLNVMDYSLLVGIHDLERGNEDKLRGKTLKVFQPGGDTAEEPQKSMLARTPSKMESAKRARELRNLVSKEKPMPIDQLLDKIPVEGSKKGFYFYTDDGGFRATHEDNNVGEEIYYLGIIDCLTKWNLIKKVENFWKGLKGNEPQISPIPPVRYGDRFIKFISGITMSRERVAQQEQRLSQGLETTAGVIIPLDGTVDDPSLGGVNDIKPDQQNPPGTARVMERAERSAEKSLEKGATESTVPERTVATAKSGGGPSEAATLPVIGEAAEIASQASKTPSHATLAPSGDAAEASVAHASNDEHGNIAGQDERHPPTPPKSDGKPGPPDSTDESRPSFGGDAPPTPPKDDRKGQRADKALPSAPTALPANALTEGPASASKLEK